MFDPTPPPLNALEDAPLVKFVNRIVSDAIHQGVSDIHFEAYENTYRIRYRQDGLLREIDHPQAALAPRIAARIKVMANLDIAEKRVPQDGSFKFTHNPAHSIDCRVSTCPTTSGEKIVVRILDTSAFAGTIETLGFCPRQQAQVLQALQRTQGMVLVTGPTGSGKTTTLYSFLRFLNTPQVNIATVEDPVEIVMPGINQVTINAKAGLHFAPILRAFLRQDPDIIMVGEMRDAETSDIAIKAAQTGHLVLSTLHTNGAVQTLTRLLNLGVPAFNLAASITLLIAQRLVRKLCEHCKRVREAIPDDTLHRLGLTNPLDKPLYQAHGCAQCVAGFAGRMALFEVLPITPAIASRIACTDNVLALTQAAQEEGMLTIYQAGLSKVLLGETTLEEIQRVRTG